MLRRASVRSLNLDMDVREDGFAVPAGGWVPSYHRRVALALCFFLMHRPASTGP